MALSVGRVSADVVSSSLSDRPFSDQNEDSFQQAVERLINGGRQPNSRLAQARGREALERRRKKELADLARQNEDLTFGDAPFGKDPNEQNEDPVRPPPRPPSPPSAPKPKPSATSFKRKRLKASRGPSSSFSRPTRPPSAALLGFANTTKTTLLGT